MILLVAWMACGALAYAACVRRPYRFYSAVLALYVIVPAAAADALTGAVRGIHLQPGTLTLVGGLMIGLMRQAKRAGRLQATSRRTRVPPAAISWRTGSAFFIVAGVFVIFAYVQTLLVNAHPTPVALLNNEVLAPVVLAILIAGTATPTALEAYVRWLTGLAALVCIYAISQKYLSVPDLWASYRSTATTSLTAGRAAATLDDPLTFGLLLSMATTLLFQRRGTLSIPYAALYVWCLALTESRIAILVSVASTSLNIFARSNSRRSRVVALVLGIGGLVISQESSLFNGLSGRIASDAGSTNARRLAYIYVLKHLSPSVVHGTGAATSKDHLMSLGLSSSAESAFLSYGIEFGFLMTAALFGGALVFVLREIYVLGLTPLAVAALGALITVQFYSSIDDLGAAAPLFWFGLGLLACQGRLLQSRRHIRFFEFRAPRNRMPRRDLLPR